MENQIDYCDNAANDHNAGIVKLGGENRDYQKICDDGTDCSDNSNVGILVQTHVISQLPEEIPERKVITDELHKAEDRSQGKDPGSAAKFSCFEYTFDGGYRKIENLLERA